MTISRKKPVGHKVPKEEMERDLAHGKKPIGKGLSAGIGPTDSNKAPNQRRMETDGLTSSENIGRNAELNDTDDTGLNKHPEVKK